MRSPFTPLGPARGCAARRGVAFILAAFALASCESSSTAPKGSLALEISGLPAGAAVSANVSGPNRYSRDVSGQTTLAGLSPGMYTVAALSTTTSVGRYDPDPRLQTVDVSSNQTAIANITYHSAPAGSLAIAISGLPQGVNADVLVTGADSFSEHLVESSTLPFLAPGSYGVSALAVRAGGPAYAPALAAQTVNVTANQSASASVVYHIVRGSLRITFVGQPAGATKGSATVTGPDGFSALVIGNTELTDLAAGTYMIFPHGYAYKGADCSPWRSAISVEVTSGPLVAVRVDYDCE
ncbi:MAG TPA: hypothetical protein VEI06_12430 [Gemmatimonadaceae bacterium]|nr:hypothetical protein [Gemmatimonadaceae bacterium]